MLVSGEEVGLTPFAGFHLGDDIVAEFHLVHVPAGGDEFVVEGVGGEAHDGEVGRHSADEVDEVFGEVVLFEDG
ncbi:MAG: hypothetical protein CMF28_03935 [Kiritimatiellaceae bacterium]|nr:hypothetical protein [Kiritimatiellaceae bacterium]